MKKLENTFLEQSIPYNYDTEKLKLMTFMKKDGNVNDKYCGVLSIYKYLFEQYLLSKINIKLYDDALLNSKLSFKKVDEDNMDIYQYYSNLDFNYIYIRNNFYIENLSLDEIKYLLDKYYNNDINIDNNTLKFIENTYKRVIKTPNSNEFIPTSVCYSTNVNPDYFVNDTKIVLGVRYDEFYKENEWDNKKYIEREKYLNGVISKMRNDLNKYGIEVLRYNSYNVLVKKNNNDIKLK